MAYTGKESKKRVDICICITDSLCYTAETNTTLQLDYTPIKSFKKKRYAHPYVHISTIHDSQDVETTYMSTDHWMNKDVHGILLSQEKWNNATTCSHMNGPRDDHTKWIKSERGRQIQYDITYTQDLKKWQKWTYKTDTHSKT